MENFCGKCGAPIGPDGRCLNCGAKGKKVKAPKPEKLREERPEGEKGSPKMKIILICAAVLVVVFAALLLLGVVRFGDGMLREGSTKGPSEIPPDKLERPSAEEHMAELGTITDRIPAKSSGTLHSEAEAAKNFADRGFAQNPVTASNTIDGEYTGKKEISASSMAKHPYYETIYTTPDNAVWSITETNGQMTAFPLTYNASGRWSVRHIVAESETVYSYDSASNQFYMLAPDGSGMILRRIDRIDAQTLDALTESEVD